MIFDNQELQAVIQDMLRERFTFQEIEIAIGDDRRRLMIAEQRMQRQQRRIAERMEFGGLY